VGAKTCAPRLVGSERVGFRDPLAHRLAGGEMFGDDAFAAGGGDLAVPDAFGVNDHPGTAAADAEAGGFCTESGDTEDLKAGFECFPGGEAVGGRAAIGADAEEDVALRGLDFHFIEAGVDGGVGHGGRVKSDE
jgi:hypothetical protein